MAGKEQPPGTDNFEFELVGPADSKAAFVGYVSSINPTAATPQVLIRGSQNVYKKLTGTIANRPGLKLRGAIDSTEAGVISSFEWETSLGFTLPVRVCNNKWQVEFNPGTGLQWYTLQSALASMKCSFAAWYDPINVKEVLLMVNGQQQINEWGGGIGLIASAANTSGIIESIDSPNRDVNANTGQFSSGGANYAVNDILTVAGGNGDARLQVDSVLTGGVLAAAVNAGGSGYNVGDILKITGETTSALIQVTAAPGGVVSAVSVIVAGSGYSGATGVATSGVLTGGSPSGLTVNINVGNTIGAFHFTNNGSGYVVSPSQSPSALTGGSGTGASIWIIAVATWRATLAGSLTASQLGFPGLLTSTTNVGSSGGSFTVAGVTYSYSDLGDNGQSFIGFGGDPSAAAGGVAVQLVVVTDTSATSVADSGKAALEQNFTNDAMTVIGNQVHLFCYTSRVVHVSSIDYYYRFDVSLLAGGLLRAPGDPDILFLDSTGRGGAAQGTTTAVIFGSRGDSYLVVRKPTKYAATASYVLQAYEDVTITKQTCSDLSSPQGQDFIVSVGGIILFLDDSNQLRQYGVLRNIVTPVYPILSLDVYREFALLNFTGGHLRAVAEQSGESLYITCPLSGITYLYQIRQSVDPLGNLKAERIWHPPFIWNGSRIAVIAGVSYIHSLANPQIYQLWETGQYHDDSPPGAQAYLCRAHWGYNSYGRRQGKFIFDKIYFEGYATPGAYLFGNAYFEYQGAKSIQQVIINSPAQPARFYSGILPDSLGDDSLGDNPLGDPGLAADPNDLIPKFRAVRSVTPLDTFEHSFEVFSFDLDVQWEILALGPNATQSPRSGVELTKKVL